MRSSIVLLCVFIAFLSVSKVAAVDLKVIFYDDQNQHGDSKSFPITISGACSGCEGFGFRVFNSWESYTISGGGSGKYALHIYDDDHCGSDTKTASLTDPSGNFPGTLKNSVDSWIICPPGVNPVTG